MVRDEQRGASKRPPKLENVLVKVRECIENGKYYDTRHASDRKNERSITRLEIRQALLHGRHVPSRDRYDEAFGELGWTYAVEGKTLDRRSLRVIVAFDETTKALIITAVDLDAD
jgi:hypothetical protein